MHRVDHAEVVDAAGHVREQLADPARRSGRAAANFNGEREQVARLARDDARLGERQRLAVVALEQRLVVERVDLRRAAVHEQEDDPLGPARGSAAAGRPAGCADRAPSARASSPSSPASASAANPPPLRRSSSRREIASVASRVPVGVHGDDPLVDRVSRGRGTRWRRRSPGRAPARRAGRRASGATSLRFELGLEAAEVIRGAGDLLLGRRPAVGRSRRPGGCGPASSRSGRSSSASSHRLASTAGPAGRSS